MSKNYLFELAKRRKSIRKFSPNPIDLEDVLEALEVACRAPSGANQQPWRFLIITEQAIKNRLRKACEIGEREFYEKINGDFKKWLTAKGLSWEKPFIEEAPILVIVFMDVKSQYARESVWASIGFFLLALEEQGLNTVPYTPSNTSYPLKEVGAPKGFQLEAIFPIGLSAEEKPREPRTRLEEVAYLNIWGKSV